MVVLVRKNWRGQNEMAGVPETKLRLIEEAYRVAMVENK